MSPKLTIAIPAYNRPGWLERALRSVVAGGPPGTDKLEIVVTDDSTTDECEQVCQTVLAPWPGRWRYRRNPQRLGMTGNWNQALQTATGDYVLVLHDDDFLLAGGVDTILTTLQKLKPDYPVLQFGVQVVNEQGSRLRDQTPSQTEWLEPAAAVYNLVRYSSFIRFPAMVVEHRLFKDLGYFDADFGGTADVEMWLRLLSQEGLYRVKACTAAYTVHSAALTMDMFNAETIAALSRIFAKAEATQLLPPGKLDQAKSDFFHQFILAGTFRYWRRRNYKQAAQTLSLFDLQALDQLTPSLKWRVLRFIFAGICQLTQPFT